MHSSWLNQCEICFFVIQRKVLTPNDFVDLDEVEQRLLAFERRSKAGCHPRSSRSSRSRTALPGPLRLP